MKHLKKFNESEKIQFFFKRGGIFYNNQLVGVEGYGSDFKEHLENSRSHTYYLIYKDEGEEEEIEEIDFYTRGGDFELDIAKAIAENNYNPGYKLISSQEHQFHWANKNYKKNNGLLKKIQRE